MGLEGHGSLIATCVPNAGGFLLLLLSLLIMRVVIIIQCKDAVMIVGVIRQRIALIHWNKGRSRQCTRSRHIVEGWTSVHLASKVNDTASSTTRFWSVHSLE